VNRIRSDGDADFAGGRRSGSEDFEEGGSAGQSEDQAERQEGELARRQDPLPPRPPIGLAITSAASVAAHALAVNSSGHREEAPREGRCFAPPE
jgi:hypothetical protein